MKKVEITFKKLLGNGRAFRTPKGFTDEFYDLFISPFVELKNKVLFLKYTHFPTKNILLDDIKNGEELFGLTDLENETLEQRAANVETQWGILNGSLNWKPLQDALNRLAINVKVVENVPPKAVNIGSLSLYGNYQYNETLEETNDTVRYGENASRIIGNGILELDGTKIDPCNVQNKGISQYGSYGYGAYDSSIDSYIQYGIKGGSANCFFITSNEPITSKQYELLTKIVLQKKPAHTVAICDLQIID